jgi:hypothetical protein
MGNNCNKANLNNLQNCSDMLRQATREKMGKQINDTTKGNGIKRAN